MQSLDSAQVAVLMNLAANDLQLPGFYARNLLHINGYIQYSEPIILPDPNLKSARKYSRGNSSVRNEPYFLKLYPNPAMHYFIVEYSINSSESRSSEVLIRICDISGQTKDIFTRNRLSDSFIVPTLILTSGMYYVALKNDGQRKNTKKVIVLK